MTEGVEIRLAPRPTDDVCRLIEELNAELSALYTDEQRHGLAVAALFQPHIRFFVAYRAKEAIGCGGVALKFGELKRMYVRRAWRSRGVADLLVSRLIRETIESGRSLLRLETGSHSFAALRFYDRLGFRLCAAFEPYAHMPPPSIITSVFMEKHVP
jgi:putative acetyltransferase